MKTISHITSAAAVLLIISLFTMQSAWGNTIYVPDDYPQIQLALYSASSGDTISVAPGTYNVFMWSGITLQDVHILGSGGWGDSISTIMGNVTENGIYLDEAWGWEIAGFEITNCTSGIAPEHCHNLNVHHNYIHNNPYSHAYGLHIEFCEGIYFHHNVLAYNNYVAVRIHYGNSDVTFDNNTILHTNSYHGFLIMGYIPDLRITNNIIAFNSDDGIQYSGGSQGDAIITYNNCYGNGTNYQNCTPGVGSISSDPLLTTISGFPYHISSISPCINAGDPEYPPDPDDTRNDIGAIYHDLTSSSITDLIITIDGTDVILAWGTVPRATRYFIYQNSVPYFSTYSLVPLDITSGTVFTDEGALTNGSFYYRVTWE